MPRREKTRDIAGKLSVYDVNTGPAAITEAGGLGNGWVRDKIIAPVQDDHGGFQLTDEGSELLPAGPFSAALQ